MQTEHTEQCPACNKWISKKATVCPNCAEPLKLDWVKVREAETKILQEQLEISSKQAKNGCLWILGIIIVLAIIGSMMPEQRMTDREEFNNSIRNLCRSTGGKDCNKKIPDSYYDNVK